MTAATLGRTLILTTSQRRSCSDARSKSQSSVPAPPPRRTCQGAPPCHTQGIRQGACPKSSIPAKLSLTDVKLGSTRQEILTLGNHILGYRKTAAVFFDWVFGWLELEKWMNRPSSRLALLIYPKTSPCSSGSITIEFCLTISAPENKCNLPAYGQLTLLSHIGAPLRLSAGLQIDAPQVSEVGGHSTTAQHLSFAGSGWEIAFPCPPPKLLSSANLSLMSEARVAAKPVSSAAEAADKAEKIMTLKTKNDDA
uniref:Uncharacterized protein n=1 Tax=Pyricularia oryzae (strain P131) TaxID=1143193 RepID=L7JHR0_PYRO1